MSRSARRVMWSAMSNCAAPRSTGSLREVWGWRCCSRAVSPRGCERGPVARSRRPGSARPALPNSGAQDIVGVLAEMALAVAAGT
jgi:hypothetical protein